MENIVRTTTLKVVKKSKEVRINQEKIKELAKTWIKRKIIIPAWPQKYHLQTKNQQAMLDYLIILDSLNFCFWNKNKKWQITYKNKKYSGYFALALALKFFKENPEKSNLEYFSKISFKEFKEILRGGKNLLFLKKRWQIARDVSGFLIKKYQGDSQKFIKSANKKFSILIPKIYKELPYFNDIADYNRKRIYFLKRTQILACDIYCAFSGRRIGYFKDLDYPTAFADYRIPQILYYYGILEYSPKLKRKIKDRVLISAGSKEEIEIRASTIWAVEYLKKELEKLGKKFYSFQIDWILWNKSKEEKLMTPYHLTKTIFY